MSFGSVSLRDFYSKAISHSTQSLPNRSVPHVSIYYKYGEKEQVIPNCHLFFDFVSSDWSISIFDPQNILCFDKFSTAWQEFSFDEHTGTLKIIGTDNRSQKKKGAIFDISYTMNQKICQTSFPAPPSFKMIGAGGICPRFQFPLR